MITYTHPVVGNLPIQTLVARQWPKIVILILCRLTCVSSIYLEGWSEVGGGRHFESKTGQVDDHVRDKEKHCHKRSNGVELAEE